MLLNGRLRRRNSMRLTPKLPNKIMLTGPSLEFRWSTAVADQTLKPAKRQPTSLPPLCNENYQQKSPIVNSTPLDRISSVSSSLSTQKPLRRLLHSNKKRQVTVTKPIIPCTSLHPPIEPCSTPLQPIILNYSQLRRTNQQGEKKRLSQSRISTEKLSTVSVATSKLSISTSSSMVSTVLPSLVEEVRLPTNNLVRLRTPQLRLLNISEKYINEAKELYFDATSRVFVPRMPTLQIS